MVKNYLFDTSILLQGPSEAIYGFQDNNIWICGTTLQEIDQKKTHLGEVGYYAREAARILDGLRSQGSLVDGIELPNGGHLYVEPDGVKPDLLPDGFSLAVADNRIISTCKYLNATKCKDSPVILLTNDISMRVNASICGVRVESVRNDRIEQSNYKGHKEMIASPDRIDSLYANGIIEASEEENDVFYENEFVTLKAGDQKSGLAIYKNGCLRLVKPQTLFGGVRPLNRMQTFAIYALMAPVEEIPLVILQGPAGTAKTFLALAAGLSQVALEQYDGSERYDKLLISRPNAGNADPGFGYLPGSLDEKMAPLLASYTDNLEAILRGRSGERENSRQIQYEASDLFDSGSIEICPLNYIRGRSLMNSYIICDEAQNATKSLIRDVVTRAGKNSKVIVTGDENQVDAPTLDRYNNGLVYLIKRMQGNPLAAIVKFDEQSCVRSPLAEAAIKALN